MMLILKIWIYDVDFKNQDVDYKKFRCMMLITKIQIYDVDYKKFRCMMLIMIFIRDDVNYKKYYYKIKNNII